MENLCHLTYGELRDQMCIYITTKWRKKYRLSNRNSF